MKKLLAFVLAAALACDSAPTDFDIGEIALLIVSGDGQSGPFNTELPDPLVVKATKPNGNPLKNQIVNFVVVEGGGSVFAGVALTNTQGLAQEFWTLGTPGPQTLEVRAVDPATGEKIVFGTFTATALGPVGQGVADNIECFDLQSGTFKLNGSCGWGARSPNETVAVQFRTVLDDGTPVADVRVALEIDPTCLDTCDNAGSVTPTEVISDASGLVNASWTLGPETEQNRLIVSINDGGRSIGVWIGAQ